jgi:hypothetical protein
MSDWTTIIRAALASLVGVMSLAASLCIEVGEAEEKPAEPVTASVSDQRAHAQVSDAGEAESVPVLSPKVVDATPSPDISVRASITDAIGEARRRQGSLLQGSTLSPEASVDESTEFSSALAQVARESDVTPVPVEPLFTPALVPAQPAFEGSVLLRQAARELESRAADNEDLRQFAEADQLRRLSTDLRREARRWDERSQITAP